jgi:protein-S-isoprenylcysteine O-methyltransferase Ste14
LPATYDVSAASRCIFHTADHGRNDRLRHELDAGHKQRFAKASLRRSFGILPANRGIVSSGAYRCVRHPLYLDYFIADIGFLLVNFGLQNLLVYGFQFTMQYACIAREEKLLANDERYCAYRSKVRYLVLPGLF